MKLLNLTTHAGRPQIVLASTIIGLVTLDTQNLTRIITAHDTNTTDFFVAKESVADIAAAMLADEHPLIAKEGGK